MQIARRLALGLVGLVRYHEKRVAGILKPLHGRHCAGQNAEIRYRARRFWLSDLGSTNGTFINGEQVAEQALRDGDTISLGGLELTFKEA